MNGNTDTIYSNSAREVWDVFAPYLDGELSGYVGVVSAAKLDDGARKALESSAKALGYDPTTCTYIHTEGLDEASLMTILEGVDPVALVICDEASAKLLQSAYRCDVPLNKASRIFCRSAVAFKDFSTMMDSSESKQRAWALLKQLPKFGEF